MNTACTRTQMEFKGLGRRKVVAAFDGGHISSDGGALLLRETDSRLGITRQLAACFTDHRAPERIEHSVLEMLRMTRYTAIKKVASFMVTTNAIAISRCT